MITTLTDDDRKTLLRLARFAIQSKLEKNTLNQIPQKLTPDLKEKRGCFVTLHKNGGLRGCIGSIEPEKPLFEGVKENAVNAAFRDPRFSPLQPHELADIEIEISVLTVPEELPYENVKELKQKLKPGVHGVILSRGWQQSTFLPQVWEQLADVESFLTHLCLKAGMEAGCWQHPDTKIQLYEAEYFSESTCQI
jgi:AmmeMemoRadiSam system protein A